MARLPIVSWIGNAAAVLVGGWGAVSRQAPTAGCSRQAAYEHATKVEEAVKDAAGGGPSREQLQRHVGEQAARIAELEKRLAEAIEFPTPQQQRFAATATATGLSYFSVAVAVGQRRSDWLTSDGSGVSARRASGRGRSRRRGVVDSLRPPTGRVGSPRSHT